MKTEQKMVISDFESKFWKQCDNLLKDGWKIIPGTVAIGGYLGSSGRVCSRVAFFEKEINNESY